MMRTLDRETLITALCAAGLVALIAGTFFLGFWPGTAPYKINTARGVVSQTLMDPGSAQFRKLQSKRGGVCGEVNAKDRTGAYSGFTPFVFTRGVAEIEPDPIDTDAVNAAVDDFISSRRASWARDAYSEIADDVDKWCGFAVTYVSVCRDGDREAHEAINMRCRNLRRTLSSAFG